MVGYYAACAGNVDVLELAALFDCGNGFCDKLGDMFIGVHDSEAFQRCCFS